MYHGWCQSWCLENPSLQVGLQSPLKQKQTTELHGMNHTTAQAVHRSSVTANTQVWYQVSPCGLCGRQNNNGIGFCPSTSTLHRIIPLMLHTHSFICQWQYTVYTNDSIIKQQAEKKSTAWYSLLSVICLLLCNLMLKIQVFWEMMRSWYQLFWKGTFLDCTDLEDGGNKLLWNSS